MLKKNAEGFSISIQKTVALSVTELERSTGNSSRKKFQNLQKPPAHMVRIPMMGHDAEGLYSNANMWFLLHGLQLQFETARAFWKQRLYTSCMLKP